MSGDDYADLTAELATKHSCQTIILYGSRAGGHAKPESDYDVAAFSPAVGDRVWDARPWRQSYLDAFIYPAADIAKTGGLMRLRGGRVLLQQTDEGDQLLAAIDRAYRLGYKTKPDDKQGMRIWHRKTFDRARLDDPVAHFRRHELLFRLLQDYFEQRDMWYEGPGKSFSWLQAHDPTAYHYFCEALQPGASDQAIQTLIDRVIEPVWPDLKLGG